MKNSNDTPPRRTGWRPLTYPSSSRQDQVEETPFVIGIIADLAGHADRERLELRNRRFRHVDSYSLDDHMKHSGIYLHFQANNRIASDERDQLAVELRFESLDDFGPENVASQVPELADMLEIRAQLALLIVRLEIQPGLGTDLQSFLNDDAVVEAIKAEGSNDNAETWAYLVESAPATIRSTLSFRTAKPKTLLVALRRRLDEGIQALTAEQLGLYASRVDAAVSAQLNEILHHPEFRRLEASWRGLAYAVREIEVSDAVKVFYLDAKMAELERDFRRSVGIDESRLFSLTHEDTTSGSYGFEPFSVLLFDYELTNSGSDLHFASKIASLGVIISAPVLIAAAPALLSLDRWEDLKRPRELRRIFHTKEYSRWKALRQNPDADYLVVVLPRLLARLPWNTTETPADQDVYFKEIFENTEGYCWMNGAYGLVTVMAHAFTRDRWCADLRGPKWGRVEGLAAEYVVENGEITQVIGPVEMDISERRHFELSELGFTAIARDLRGEFAAFPNPVTVANCRDAVDGQETFPGRLEHILCVGRIKHAVGCYLKDHSGIWSRTPDAIAAMTAWLSDYVVSADAGLLPSDPGEMRPPFRYVQVKLIDIESRKHDGLQLQFTLNYAEGVQAPKSIVLVFFPSGFHSVRLIP